MEMDQSLRRSNLLLLWFLCLFLLPLARPTHQPRISMASFSARRLLSHSASRSTQLHPENGVPSPQFEESKHEVPSGPNPVSNR
ncbi:hypothetical protein COCNU_09G009710 [Cocos nucifera]|uniref:Uncharacterized protein n=1 Tax=Cocos nucifera TaxID=13894 RepID=A0A8K0IKT3_COCNU|nr:hypothetical protein COCNU_09G009710 [Cocos nucifera]